MDQQPVPLLKDILSAAAMRMVAREIKATYRPFNSEHFLTYVLDRHGSLSLMQRLRRLAEGLHVALRLPFPEAEPILRMLAPRLPRGFIAMALSEYVALYGQDDFELSMDALAYLTRFGSSEFAVRHFLRRDLGQGLTILKRWSLSDDEHVRRLSSEGCRPRLPWSFRLTPLMDDPSPVAPILENLRADSIAYVRRSVANHLNDITKDNPDWALDRIKSWPLTDRHTAWIARHALRSLIKQGNRHALAVIGADRPPVVLIHDLVVRPQRVTLGERIDLSFTLQSTVHEEQRIVVDYAIYYVKRAGGISRKVFKLKTITLRSCAVERLTRGQSIHGFATRRHYAGRHEIEILGNGVPLGRTHFDLALA